MVNFIDCGQDELIYRTKDKTLYCFGAGKYLEDFANEKYRLAIKGIIDNYCYIDTPTTTVNGMTVEIISINKFLELCDETCAVIITSSFFMEILEQLDSIEQLDGMDCYIELFVRYYTGDIRKDLELKIAQIHERNKNIYRANHAIESLSNRKKYQIWECLGEYHIAGGKAPRDIKNILEERGYYTINIHPYKTEAGESDRNWSYRRLMEEWKNTYDLICPNSLLFLQYPFIQKQNERKRILDRLKLEKNIRIITLIHDVEQLRKIFLNTFSKEEFDFIMDISDILIVHNDNMLDYFLKIGVRKSKIISLGIFDYLYSETGQKKKFERSITIAGNLDRQKSLYIGKLEKLCPLKVHLYGPNYMDKIVEHSIEGNIIYHGSYPSDQIPKRLDKGFGLVWDGDSLDTCSGPTGEYLRYNNPHKLSLYLSSGLPVIIWREAAEAAFVEEHGVGFTVNSLYEIYGILERMEEEQYIEYLNHVQKVSEKLVQGVYTSIAIQRAEDILTIEPLGGKATC